MVCIFNSCADRAKLLLTKQNFIFLDLIHNFYPMDVAYVGMKQKAAKCSWSRLINLKSSKTKLIHQIL